MQKPSIIKEWGYVWLSPPRTGVAPFDIFEQSSGWLSSLVWGTSTQTTNNSIFSLFEKKDKEPPTAHAPQEIPNFDGTDTMTGKAGFGSDILKKLTNGNVSAELEKSSSLTFAFKNPKQVNIGLMDLEKYINTATLNEDAAGFVDKLKNGKLFVVTSVLQCSEFTVDNTANFKGSIGGSGKVPTGAGIVLGDAKVNANGALTTESKQNINYKDDEKPIVVAIKLVKIQFNENTKKCSLIPASVATARNTSDEPLTEETIKVVYFEEKEEPTGELDNDEFQV